jgi:LL-diaminopimelate aminotransferase
MLPNALENRFQRIKKTKTAAIANGVNIIDLGVGQPQCEPFLIARKAAAEAVMRSDAAMHDYQDNGESGIPGFSKRFVQQHVSTDLATCDDLAYLPIPGIKSMLGLILLACHSYAGKDRANGPLEVMLTTNPGYDTPEVWAESYLGLKVWTPELNAKNKFLVELGELDNLSRGDLLMFNYPHNPSGAVASRAWWEMVCSYCEENEIRIFNDAAYAILPHTGEHCTLTDVAVDHPDLSFIEAFSSSKAGNFTGWRVGAMVGSADFIGDLIRIKGNSDSGFAAFSAAGVIAAFEQGRGDIDALQREYCHRIGVLSSILSAGNMERAVNPGGGFFTLWKAPQSAFGQKVEDAEAFNKLMIENTGLLGVPFGRYIRYAVCGDINPVAERIAHAIGQAEIVYG